MNKWTKEEEWFLLENYNKMTVKELANKLNRTEGMIRSKKERMDLRKGNCPLYTVEEKEIIKKWYNSHLDELDLENLSQIIDRPTTSICRIAKKLKLTNLGRKPNWFIEEAGKRLIEYTNTKEGKITQLKGLEKSHQIFKDNHPKGMLGKYHSKQTKNNMSKSTKIWWENISEQQKKKL
jgi:hypothetical protein